MGCDLGNICAKPVKNVKKDMICGQRPDVLHLFFLFEYSVSESDAAKP
jgi:hypothetical protein